MKKINERDKAIIAMRKKTKPVHTPTREIAKCFKISHTRVWYILKKYGDPAKKVVK